MGVVAGAGGAQTKKMVATAADLPGFAYKLDGPPSALVAADDATFRAFADRVKADIDGALTGYESADKATLRTLYSAERGRGQVSTGIACDSYATRFAVEGLTDGR